VPDWEHNVRRASGTRTYFLIEQLKARHVEQGVEGCPEIAVVARVLLQDSVEHVVRHRPDHSDLPWLNTCPRGPHRNGRNQRLHS
jgi:hypothetical protein